MLRNGIIRPSQSPTASPLVCVLKGKEGCDGVRLAIDYRYVNRFTRDDANISYSFDTGVFRRVSLFCYWLSADFADILSSSDLRGRVAALITTSVGYGDIISSSISTFWFYKKTYKCFQDVSFLFHRHFTLGPHSLITGVVTEALHMQL